MFFLYLALIIELLTACKDPNVKKILEKLLANIFIDQKDNKYKKKAYTARLKIRNITILTS
jgi:hypothetical protein